MSPTAGKVYLSAAFILAGSSVVAARYVTDTLAPFTITWLSLAIALLTALALRGREMVHTCTRLDRSQWKMLILQALFGIFLFRVLLTFGLLYTSTAEAGILTGASPAITALLTFCILGDRLRARSIVGVIITLAGILLLQGFPFNKASFQASHLLGNTLALGAAACESLFVVLSRKMFLGEAKSQPLSPLVQSGLVSALALIMCLIPMLMEQPWASIAALSWPGWGALVWYGSLVTVVAFACMFAGARVCDGYTIAAFSGLIPLSALVLSIIVLGEATTVWHWLGCFCIILAILVMNRRK